MTEKQNKKHDIKFRLVYNPRSPRPWQVMEWWEPGQTPARGDWYYKKDYKSHHAALKFVMTWNDLLIRYPRIQRQAEKQEQA